MEDKKSIVELFLARFTLSEQEIEIVKSRDTPIGLRFFQTMDKTEKIRDDCRVLMAGEDGPTQAGYVFHPPSLVCNSDTDVEWISCLLRRPTSNKVMRSSSAGHPMSSARSAEKCRLRLAQLSERLSRDFVNDLNF